MVVSTNFPGTEFNTVLYVRENDCDSRGSELACDDDVFQNAFGTTLNSQILFDVVAGRNYSVFVDGFSATDVGQAEVGLGYGGHSPVYSNLESCTTVAYDIYRLFVESGESIHVRADTVAAATAGDLYFRIYDTDGTTLLDTADDDFACTYPPPSFQCPETTITAPNTGFITVHLRSLSSCADPSNAEYELTANRDGSPAVLMQMQDQ
jgi:hypothetical protein